VRVFHVGPDHSAELGALPEALPAAGFVWVGCEREEFGGVYPEVQAALQRWGAGTIVDLHLSDLLNSQLPSQFDDTSWYELLVMRRLGPGNGGGTGSLGAVDTSPVGFVVFDRVLISVHPAPPALREHFAQRLAERGGGNDLRGGSRLPTSPAELMLRMVNHIVDGYLELRRALSRDLGALEQRLLAPRSRFSDWRVLLDARNRLQELEEIGEDQRSAVQEWIDALDEWPHEEGAEHRRERELLRVRSRDLLEHVERVLAHVRRLEQSAESAMQMHFSALQQRTNDIMRTLTVLTAVFLPLNLITGFFGMNFDALPLIHSGTAGIGIAVALMLVVFVALIVYFRRKRYLGSHRR